MSLGIILGYLALVMLLGVVASRLMRRTAEGFFLASRRIGPFMLLMSLFGTTMTAFALIGSTGEAFEVGIGVYGLIASWSAIVHTVVFFFVGTRVWSLGKRFGYLTQLDYFRDRFQSDALVLLMFPVLVAFVLVYILMGVIGAGRFLSSVSPALSYPQGMAIVCIVVMCYVFLGGMRATAWANSFQTVVFMAMGIVAFVAIANALGGPAAATRAVLEDPEAQALARRAGIFGGWEFATYGLVTLSVAMFPHLFQHWLTARRAGTFKLTIVAYPVCMLVVWVPCVLLGFWAAAQLSHDVPPNAVLALMVSQHAGTVLTGLVGAGVMAAIMSSMDSQFLCLSSLFTNNIVDRYFSHRRLGDGARILLGRLFVVLIVLVSYAIGYAAPAPVFDLGVWCFTGFAGLVPVLLGALYWPRANHYGAIAGVLAVAALWLYFLPDVLAPDRSHAFLLFDIGVMPVTLVLAVSSAAMVLGSLLTPPPPQALVERFFPGRPEGSSAAAAIRLQE